MYAHYPCPEEVKERVEEIVKEYGSEFEAVVRSCMVRYNEWDVEDILQEFYMDLHEILDLKDGRSNLKTFLIMVLRGYVFNWENAAVVRFHRRHHSIDWKIAEPSGGEPLCLKDLLKCKKSTESQVKVIEREILAEVLRLAKKDKKLVEVARRGLRNWTRREIAEELGISPGLVSEKLKKIRKILRKNYF